MLKRSITIAFLAASLAGFAPAADAAARSAKAKAEFKRLHHCPATDRSRGACPGYVIDHVVPLCAGGADRPSNMQWQTISEGKAKDKIERKQCRRQGPSRLATTSPRHAEGRRTMPRMRPRYASGEFPEVDPCE